MRKCQLLPVALDAGAADAGERHKLGHRRAPFQRGSPLGELPGTAPHRPAQVLALLLGQPDTDQVLLPVVLALVLVTRS